MGFLLSLAKEFFLIRATHYHGVHCLVFIQLWPSCDFQTLGFPFFPAWKSLVLWWAHILPLLTLTSYAVLPNPSHIIAHRENDNLCRQTGETDKAAFGWSLVQLPWEENIVQGTFLMLAGKLCVVEREFLYSVAFYSSYTGTSNTVIDRTHSLPLRNYITLAYVWI